MAMQEKLVAGTVGRVEEMGLIGQLEQGIDLSNRPQVKNPDGSTSTIRSISINEEGREILLPTVINGKVVSNEEAIAHYHQTGEHLGVFADQQSADQMAQKLHEEEAQRPRKRLAEAIKRSEAAGYKVPHFLGTPGEPEGDRAPTMDMENLVAGLKQQEKAAPDDNARAEIAAERAYWENQIATKGMSAEQWRKQTGEPDPEYPNDQALAQKDLQKNSPQGENLLPPKPSAVVQMPEALQGVPIPSNPDIKQWTDEDRSLIRSSDDQS
jgi:hypothetical protein